MRQSSTLHILVRTMGWRSRPSIYRAIALVIYLLPTPSRRETIPSLTAGGQDYRQVGYDARPWFGQPNCERLHLHNAYAAELWTCTRLPDLDVRQVATRQVC